MTKHFLKVNLNPVRCYISRRFTLEHISYKPCSSGLLSRVKHYVSKTSLITIYYSIFNSHLVYACEVWGQNQNNLLFMWGTHLYMSLFPSVHLSDRRASYLRNYTSSDHNFWYTYVKWRYLQGFFHFYKTLNFWAVRGVKGQKIAQNQQ